MKAWLHTDGGARGNPGPAGIGVVLRDEGGKVIASKSGAIGFATNNVAEYTALIEGLRLALAHGVAEVVVHVDSELVASQVTGAWKIKNDRLRALAAEASGLLNRFAVARVVHVPRERNADADKLANQGMDAAALDAELGPEWEAPDGRRPRGDEGPDQTSLLG